MELASRNGGETVMKALAAFGLVSAMTLAATSPADARQGCGPGMHRIPNGMCVPNRGRQVVYVEGRYYPGHGYWYQNRWYHRRMRWHNSWRYR
jgi:hypothetical protein